MNLVLSVRFMISPIDLVDAELFAGRMIQIIAWLWVRRFRWKMSVIFDLLSLCGVEDFSSDAF